MPRILELPPGDMYQLLVGGIATVLLTPAVLPRACVLMSLRLWRSVCPGHSPQYHTHRLVVLLYFQLITSFGFRYIALPSSVCNWLAADDEALWFGMRIIAVPTLIITTCVPSTAFVESMPVIDMFDVTFILL